MIKIEGGKLETNGDSHVILVEFLVIYKYLEVEFKKHGENFRSLLLAMIFDSEFEKIKPTEAKSNIINFEEIKKR